jgi:hypothetical protein
MINAFNYSNPMDMYDCMNYSFLTPLHNTILSCNFNFHKLHVKRTSVVINSINIPDEEKGEILLASNEVPDKFGPLDRGTPVEAAVPLAFCLFLPNQRNVRIILVQSTNITKDMSPF